MVIFMLNTIPVRGFLCDITGVLYNTNHEGGAAISGSIQAVKRLYKESKIKFLSNESTDTRQKFVEKLNRLGFELKPEDVFTPAPGAAQFIKENNLRPHLLVHDEVRPEFDGCEFENPNCVVVGDAEDNFTYENLNQAFRLLHNKPDNLLLSLGTGKFYQRTDGPALDVGAFTTALIYATGCKHVEMGKPSPNYFLAAVNSLELKPEEVVMIGDDIVSDVGGAQKVGIRAVQVRTGKFLNFMKFRPAWENHETIKPDLIADNLNQAVELILGSN